MTYMTNKELADRLDIIRHNMDDWNHPITAASDLDEAAHRLRLGVHVEEDVLFWAFRYCLSRSSYAVSDGVRAVTSNWSRLRRETKTRIHDEIRQHLANPSALVYDCDRESWNRVLNLPVNHD